MSLIKDSKKAKQILFSNNLASRGSGRVPNKSCCLTPQAHQVGVARQTPLISENMKQTRHQCSVSSKISQRCHKQGKNY